MMGLYLLTLLLNRNGKKGYKITYRSYSNCYEQYVNPRDDYRICLDNKVSGHFYESEVLLKHRETYSYDQADRQTYQGYHPAFHYEYTADRALWSAEMAQGHDVRTLFDQEHCKAAEDVECDDDDDENQDHVDGDLLVLHHPVEGFVLLEAVFDLEVWTEFVRDLLLKSLHFAL